MDGDTMNEEPIKTEYTQNGEAENTDAAVGLSAVETDTGTSETVDEKSRYIGKMLDGRYEILSVIGEGGMAIVYKALCHRLNRYDAVKIMRDDMANDEEFRRRFCAESHAVAMLSHPNIVAVYDVSHSDEIEYIVMELINGITMRQYMDKLGALEWKQATHFAKQIAKALAHAHEHGIIHRDIKPHNIMLLKDGTIKVADFGIAALENEVHETNGETIGSIHYMAPEQARGCPPDARGDVYSLGVVMYEMLSGELPYNGDSLGEIAIKHMNTDPKPIHEIVDGVPEELERITYKAMNPNIEQRYQSANELLADLDEFVKNANENKIGSEEDGAVDNVKPLRTSNELSRDAYIRRRRRASRVSFHMGSFGLLITTILLFVFLWNYWLEDVFSPAVRMPLPNFVGRTYDEVLKNEEAIYNFNITYVITDEALPGTIISQEPEANRSVMVDDEGINVNISISSEVKLLSVPNVEGYYYQEATLQLENLGYAVDCEFITSDTVEKSRVMSMSPTAGEQINSGSTIYLTVSNGPVMSYVDVPNLIGLSEEAAKIKLETQSLSFGGSDYVSSPLEAGTVVGQNPGIGTTVEEHGKVYLHISKGEG